MISSESHATWHNHVMMQDRRLLELLRARGSTWDSSLRCKDFLESPGSILRLVFISSLQVVGPS